MAGVQFAFVLLKELTSKLSSELWDELGLLWNFKQDLEDIKSTLAALEAVLKDAERQSVKDEAVLLWLKKLKAALYDIEDMLNDFAQEKMEVKRGRRFFSSSNLLISREAMARKMKKMRERLQKIAEEKSKYALKVESVTDKQEEIKKLETFSCVDKTKVLGREEEKEKLIGRLLARENQTEVSVISIVGIGGLGKTTLARLIFNDDRTSVFHVKVWFHAIEFDVQKLAKAIVLQSGAGQWCDLDNLESASICIQNSLRYKRYLIVLDDVWNEDVDKWENLKLMLQGGDSGSRILVTTRNLQIASMMSATESPHSLKYLSDDDCWKLFEQRAFGSGGVQRRPILVRIGKKIVKKCRGVPLAANALGGTLRGASGEEAWKNVRDNEIWEINQPSENEILASLKISYQYMRPPIKLCFLYCSIYPKSFELDKDKLIQQWIAQGFIQSQKKRSSLENGESYVDNYLLLLEIGEDYVNYLLSISFLQDRKEHEKTRRIIYKMHDLVYDLARSIAGDEVLAIEAGKQTTRNVKECRYASLIGYEDPSGLQKALPNKARALHFRGCTLLSLPDDAFSRTRCVRVLDLNGCFIDELPTSIRELKQLRYVDASHRHIQILDSIVKLQNLEVLNLRDCPINELPPTIGELRNLCLLNLSGCLNISTLPLSIGDLYSLLYLDLSGCYQVRQLPESICSLKNLCSLNLGSCSSLQALPQSIGNLESLKLLDLSNCSSLLELPESVGNLQNLQNLILHSCKFKVLPETLSNLINLETLDLTYCWSLQELPESIGNLQNLQTLILRGDQLKVLPETLSNLVNLETLDLRDCGSLKHLPLGSGLKNLCFLNLDGCSSLQTLHQSFGHLERLKHLDFSSCRRLQELPESIGNLQNLQTLILSSDQLKVLPETLSNLVNLETLDLRDCGALEHLPLGSGVKNLCFLNLDGCSSLQTLHQSFGHLERLKHLDFSSCRRLQKLPESIGNLQNLQTLILRSDQLEVLPETLSNLTNLETLDLTHCRLLDHMPSRIGRLTKLRRLRKFLVGDIVVEGGRASSSRSRGCNIAELEHLNLLTGDLEILFKCGVYPDDAKRANLKEKEIHSLTLNWSFDKQSGTDHAAILDHLVPHRNLTFLKIKGFSGVNFPSWMMKEADEFLPKLVEIELSDMLKCDCVPVLGHLRHLQKIVLRSMPRIRSISTTDLCGYGSDRATSFPPLKVLVLSDMPNLEEWVTADDDNGKNSEGGSCCAFPCLAKLTIVDCPRLRIRPRIPLSVVELTLLGKGKKALSESSEVKTWKEEHPYC